MAAAVGGGGGRRACHRVRCHVVTRRGLTAAAVCACVPWAVRQGDVLHVAKIGEAEVGKPLELDQVLLVGSRNSTIIGRPVVPGAKVRHPLHVP